MFLWVLRDIYGKSSTWLGTNPNTLLSSPPHPPAPVFSIPTARVFSAMENNVRPVQTAAEVEEDLKIKERMCKETESGW